MAKQKRRRSLKYDVFKFCGMQYLETLFKKARLLSEEKLSEENYGVVVGLFQTGCRVSELITLQPRQFFFFPDGIDVMNVPVLKKKRGELMRNIYIKKDRDNPSAQGFEDFVKNKQNAGWKYLYPTKNSFTSQMIPERHCSRTTIYRRCIEVDENTWPHWFRSMRARHLTKFRIKDPYVLKDWYGWATLETAAEYLGIRDAQIKKEMGIEH